MFKKIALFFLQVIAIIFLGALLCIVLALLAQEAKSADKPIEWSSGTITGISSWNMRPTNLIIALKDGGSITISLDDGTVKLSPINFPMEKASAEFWRGVVTAWPHVRDEMCKPRVVYQYQKCQ